MILVVPITFGSSLSIGSEVIITETLSPVIRISSAVAIEVKTDLLMDDIVGQTVVEDVLIFVVELDVVDFDVVGVAASVVLCSGYVSTVV